MSKRSAIAIVEDDQFFRESMRRLLRSLDFDVAAFASAADFLASPHLVEMDCLIADIHMPTMSGIELYKSLIATGYRIPTILVTAFANEVDRINALNDGVIGYLSKPVDEQHLLRCLNAALRSRKPPEENS